MSSLGETFRREREARGVSLEEISKETRIGVRLLRAIESGEFDRLPGGIFNKSFVRQYARYLGLDEETAVREYQQALGQGRESTLPQRPAPPEMPVFSSGDGYTRIILLAVCLGMAAVGIAYGVYHFQDRLISWIYPAGGGSGEPAAVSTAPSPALRTGEPSPESSPSTGPLPATGQPSDALPAFPDNSSTSSSLPEEPGIAPASPSASLPKPAEEAAGAARTGEGLHLRIDSRNPVWLSITVDGAKQWQGTLRTNQSREVQAAESVRLTVGDAGAVELTLNGKPLPPLGRSGEVKTVTINAKGTPESAP